MEADFACAQFGEEGGGSVEGFEVAGGAGEFDGVSGGVEEDAVGGNEADLELARPACRCVLCIVCHGLGGLLHLFSGGDNVFNSALQDRRPARGCRRACRR